MGNNKTDEKFSIQDAWIECEENVLKILKDIWTTGEVKNTYGLDLNWPQTKEVKTIENPAPEQKPKTNERVNEQSNQKNNKIYWIIGGLIFLALVGLIIWLAFRKKVKNK